MKNFKGLLFWESFFIGTSAVVWGFVPDYNVSAAAAVVAVVVAFAAAAAFTVAFAATAAFTAAAAAIAVTALIAALALVSELRLQLLPVVISVVAEFAAMFLLFNYNWPLAAALGVLILFGMRYLPERLVVRLD